MLLKSLVVLAAVAFSVDAQKCAFNVTTMSNNYPLLVREGLISVRGIIAVLCYRLKAPGTQLASTSR